MSNKFTSIKPFIVMMYGFPGSGKTLFGKQLAGELKAIHLQEDKIAEELFGGNNPEALKSARSAMNYMADEFLAAGISVVYDGDVTRQAERKYVRELAHYHKAAQLLVWLQVDPETCFVRTQKRDRRKSEDKYAKPQTEESFRTAIARMQNPTTEDYTVISGKHTFQTQRSTVMKKLYDLGVISPETANQNVVKPGLVNLIPQQPQGRGEFTRRNISIR